jgi:hypothetical protein
LAGKNSKNLTWFKLRIAEAGTKAGVEEDEEEARQKPACPGFSKMMPRDQERTASSDVSSREG